MTSNSASMNTTSSTPKSESTTNVKPLAVDNDIFRQRLLTKEGGDIAGRGQLSDCVTRFRSYTHQAWQTFSSQNEPTLPTVTDSNEEDRSKSGKRKMFHQLKSINETLKNDLMLHRLEMKKMALMAKTAEVELQDYEKVRMQVNDSIGKLRSEIDGLNQLHTMEKRVRRNREQYELLAKEANQRPPCGDTESKLAKLNEEIKAVREEDNKVTRELKLKEKQTQLLMQSIFDLKSTLVEDENEKKDAKVEEEEKNEGKEEIEEGEENGTEEGDARDEEGKSSLGNRSQKTEIEDNSMDVS